MRAAASAPARGGSASASGSSSGSRTGCPIPNPGIAALPQASSGVGSDACRAGLGDVRGHERVVEPGERVRQPVMPVRAGRVRQVAERQRDARRS